MNEENINTKTCPKCKNSDCLEDDNYCFMCGALLLNFCSDSSCIMNDNQEDEKTELPPNHRYCPECGSETTFKKQGYFD